MLMHCHLNEPPPRPSAKVAEIPKTLDDLIVDARWPSRPPTGPGTPPPSALKLTELRDKAERAPRSRWSGPRAGPESANPPRAGRSQRRRRLRRRIPEEDPQEEQHGHGSTQQQPVTRRTPKRLFLAQSLRDRNRGSWSWPWSRSAASSPTVVWPPSAEYLYKHAEALMASDTSRRLDRRPSRNTSSRSTSGFPTIPTASRPGNGATRSCSRTPKAGPRSSTSGVKTRLANRKTTPSESS